jgi:hypothetical protein
MNFSVFTHWLLGPNRIPIARRAYLTKPYEMWKIRNTACISFSGDSR